MRHSPEPWKIENGVLLDSVGSRILHYNDNGCELPDDADRIVACVNACWKFTNRDLAHGMIQDMITALVTKAPALIDLVSGRLHDILKDIDG